MVITGAGITDIGAGAIGIGVGVTGTGDGVIGIGAGIIGGIVAIGAATGEPRAYVLLDSTGNRASVAMMGSLKPVTSFGRLPPLGLGGAVDDCGPLGRSWRETSEPDTDRATLIHDLLHGHHENPIWVSTPLRQASCGSAVPTAARYLGYGRWGVR